MKRGLVVGAFTSPDAGRIFLCETARALVDELTVLVHALPANTTPDQHWLHEVLPGCRVVHSTANKDWSSLVAAVPPEPIDFLFAEEGDGLRLAKELGAVFVPVSARVMGVVAEWDGGWPPPAATHSVRTICLHGVESTGKSVLSERLARHYGTVWVPEYGRAHAETHGTEMDEADLLLIGAAQDAMRAASLRWCDKRLFLDTDPLMTAAWRQMMLGDPIPEVLFDYPKADLYLMLEGDTGWIADSVRIYGDATARARFNAICRDVLERAGVNWVSIGGPWEGRFEQALVAVDALGAPRPPAG